VISEQGAARRPTRAEQRAATRHAILAATADCLAEDGLAALTTRAVAERANVAQSTVMNHFETREALLVETVTQTALRLADGALERLDLAALRMPELREAVIDEAWREFTSPHALAVAQLWFAVWTEPELAGTLRELEERLTAIILATVEALFPDLAGEPRHIALIDATVSLIRGLVMALPVWGQDVVDARWNAIKPILLDAAAQLLDSSP
jgi:AcrR family transcriptional regulator